ncbi:MAG: hypothetical protein JSR59_21905 [Proteobacteria bacterium]|nr:hypothetical protein [Pseudomonadota bacterium]
MTPSVQRILAEATAALQRERYAGTDVHLVPKGGRPPETARDIAILLARWAKEKELGTKARADAWIMEKWAHRGVTDVRHVRVRANKAKAALPKNFVVLVGDRTGLHTVFARPPKGSAPGTVFLWTPHPDPETGAHLLEAIEVNVEHRQREPEPFPSELTPLASSLRGRVPGA